MVKVREHHTTKRLETTLSYIVEATKKTRNFKTDIGDMYAVGLIEQIVKGGKYNKNEKIWTIDGGTLYGIGMIFNNISIFMRHMGGTDDKMKYGWEASRTEIDRLGNEIQSWVSRTMDTDEGAPGLHLEIPLAKYPHLSKNIVELADSYGLQIPEYFHVNVSVDNTAKT